LSRGETQLSIFNGYTFDVLIGREFTAFGNSNESLLSGCQAARHVLDGVAGDESWITAEAIGKSWTTTVDRRRHYA
jgi:hypothetical protein